MYIDEVNIQQVECFNRIHSSVYRETIEVDEGNEKSSLQ